MPFNFCKRIVKYFNNYKEICYTITILLFRGWLIICKKKVDTKKHFQRKLYILSYKRNPLAGMLSCFDNKLVWCKRTKIIKQRLV